MALWLKNIPLFRVKEYPQGWLVEVQKKNIFGFKKWVCIINYIGNDDPFYFSTKESAINHAVKYFDWDLLIVTNHHYGF